MRVWGGFVGERLQSCSAAEGKYGTQSRYGLYSTGQSCSRSGVCGGEARPNLNPSPNRSPKPNPKRITPALSMFNPLPG